MEKEFVPYDIALAMKKLGFDWKCFTFYKQGGRLETTTDISSLYFFGGVLAPLYQQAFRWFREEYNIDVFPSKTYNYYFSIYLNDELYEESNGIKPLIEGKTYEKAEQACLEKLIEIVEEKQK